MMCVSVTCPGESNVSAVRSTQIIREAHCRHTGKSSVKRKRKIINLPDSSVGVTGCVGKLGTGYYGL
jgi:hypothetical protein